MSAAPFTATFQKAQSHFAALAKLEDQHANHDKVQLAKLVAQIAAACLLV
jgi:hypothetical protein